MGDFLQGLGTVNSVTQPMHLARILFFPPIVPRLQQPRCVLDLQNDKPFA